MTTHLPPGNDEDWLWSEPDEAAPRPRARRRWVRAGLAALAVLGVLAAAVVGAGRLQARYRAQDRREAAAAAAAWLAGWQDGDYAAVDRATAGDDAPGDALRRTDARLQPTAKVLGPGPLSADGTVVPYSARFALAGLGTFAWSSRLALVKTRAGWRVAFDSATVHPALVNGRRLDRRSRPGARAAIADRTGLPIRPRSRDLAENVLGQVSVGHGQSGLERVLDARLQGRATGAVVVTGPYGEEVSTLQTYAPAAVAPVRTTLDLTVQRAAERALVGLSSPAALVAVDSATGQVRAVADAPVSGTPPAFTSWAPGSVFKTVTAAALLDAGLSPGSPVDCPPTYRGTGNAADVRPGPSTLAQAFAQSCNTAFLSSADRLPAGALAASAAFFGFGPAPLLPIATDSSDFPPGTGPEDATAAIGQGRVEATPLLMATAMAAVESGTWRTPSLLPDQTGRAVRPLSPSTAEGLRALLRGAVVSGTGRGADLPGAPVSGKTGTAETGLPGQLHTWFAGYRDGLAFCVFVQQGVSGARTAVPVADAFLRAL